LVRKLRRRPDGGGPRTAGRIRWGPPTRGIKEKRKGLEKRVRNEVNYLSKSQISRTSGEDK